MQFILYLIQKHRNFLLFFVLQLIAFFFTIQYHSYRKSKFINSANNISGGIYNNVTSFRTYLYLKDENTLLTKENSLLKNQLFLKNKAIKSVFKDSIDATFQQKFTYSPAKIINNDFHKRNNYLTLSVGEKDSIQPDMAVVNSLGIIGITSNTSTNYATAISVLNTNFRVNARLKNNEYFGTLTWNGKEQNIVQLQDIPRQAKLSVGDTIVTGGRSAIFPEGILIGNVTNIKFEHNQYQQIDIHLFNDVKNVSNVYIIKNLHKTEIKQLEKQTYD